MNGALMAEGFFTRGVYAPVEPGRVFTDLPVHGTLPPELDGLLVRNGPNPSPESLRGGGDDLSGWFSGDGMLHGIRIGDGRAHWYRNQYVKTAMLGNPEGDVPNDSPANTHVIGHNGKILALCEAGWPYQVTPQLDTVGMTSFGGALEGPMTAHPKIDASTGEMIFFGYNWQPPYLRYHVADSAGNLTHSVEIDVNGPTMMHDFAITATRSLFMDLPVVFSLELAMTGNPIPYIWDEEYGARIGIVGRTGQSADVTWFEIDPCYVFHTFNAYDDGDTVVLDAARYDKMQVWDPVAKKFSSPSNSYLVRYRFNMATGASTCHQLSDLGVDFPRIDLARAGLNYRYGYGALIPDSDLNTFIGLAKFDLTNGDSIVYSVGDDHVNGEPIFVPAQGQSAEDDGYLLVVNYDKTTDLSEVLVLDAQTMTEVIAKIELPVRIPMGFHGSWLPWDSLAHQST